MARDKDRVPVWVRRDAHAKLKELSAKEGRPIFEVLTSIIRNLDADDPAATQQNEKSTIAPYGGVWFA